MQKQTIIDEEYARMYNGKMILRFDDTNPLNEKIEYYQAIRDGLEWLGIKPDLVKNTSDDISVPPIREKTRIRRPCVYMLPVTERYHS